MELFATIVYGWTLQTAIITKSSIIDLARYPRYTSFASNSKTLKRLKTILAFLRIRSTITAKENTNVNTIFPPVNSDEVKQCLQRLRPRKAIGQDKTPSALIKMAAEPLSTQLSIAINNSFKYNIFRSNAKVACVKPLDKKTESKHCIQVFSQCKRLKNLRKVS